MSEKKRWAYDCQGRILTLDSGMTVVPYQRERGSWYAVVVDPGPQPECQKSYPRGGYNIVVSDRDVETAAEHALPADSPQIAPLQAPRNAEQGDSGPIPPTGGNDDCMKYGSEVE